MAYSIMRMEKIKSVAKGNARLKHSRREIDCPTADKNRSQYNTHIYCNDQARENYGKTFGEIFKEKTNGQKIRKNAVCAVEVLVTFSPGGIKPEQEKEWAIASMRWIGKELGGMDNIIGAELHRDEKTTHIHAFVIPIDEKGKLNARTFLGGTNNRMSEIQTSYAKEMERFGLERGISKKITHAHHQSSQRWHAENAQKEARLQTYEEIFGKEKDWDIDNVIAFRRKESEIEKKIETEAPKSHQNESIENLKAKVFDNENNR